MNSLLSPLRVFVTFALVLTFSGIAQSAITVTTNAPLPTAQLNVAYFDALSATGGTAAYMWTIISGALPPGLSLSADGVISGTPETVTGSFTFTVQASEGPNTGQKALTIDVRPLTFSAFAAAAATITVSTNSPLPAAQLNAAYLDQLNATGGTAPYSWKIIAGGLPLGLSLSTAGVISGTPATFTGNFNFVVQASDGNSSTPGQKILAIDVAPFITTVSLPNGLVQSPYSQALSTAQTTPGTSLTWTVSAGSLPAGLSINASTGIISGTPTTAGTSSFTVKATDSASQSSTAALSLTVDPPAFSIKDLPAILDPTQVFPNVGNVILTLAAPNAGALTGQLIMTFSSTAEVPADDPATKFSSGSRTVSFTIPANATTAVLPISLLTGTVAGTITLTANLENGPSNLLVASSDVRRTPPQMTNVTATRTAAGFDVQIVGYAPARRVTSATFTFDLKNGTKTSLSGNVDANFAAWYKNAASSPYGSAFLYVQSFNVTGDVTQILDVTVQLTNAQGSTTSAVVKLP